MSAQPIRAAFAHKLPPAVSFKAWRVALADQGNPRHEAQPVDLPEWVDDAETAAKLACSCLLHKGSILVLRTDAAERPERRNLLTVFVVKRKASPGWRAGPDGRSVREPAEYPDFVMEVCVHDDFEPVRPWRFEEGNAAGRDLTLVEG